TDTVGGATATASGTAQVEAAPPDLNVTLNQSKAGRRVEVTAQYSNLEPGHHTAVIDWGDGKTSMIDLGTATAGSFTLSHTYSSSFVSRNYNPGTDLKVTILNDDGSVAVTETLHVDFSFMLLSARR